MKKNLLTIRQLCIWIVRIWEITGIASIITTSGTWIIHEVCISYSAVCVWGSVNVMACMYYLLSSSSIFSLSRWVKNNNQILKSVIFGGNAQSFPLGICSPLNGLLAWGERQKQTECLWLKAQQSWWQNVSQCLLILGMKDSSDFAEDLEVGQACPNKHASIKTNKALWLNSFSSLSVLLPHSP